MWVLSVLTALIAASGHSGLSALLPSPATIYAISPASPIAYHDHLSRRRPHMPSDTPKWNDTDFSLGSMIRRTGVASGGADERKVDLRTFCLRLIQRYQFVAGQENALFSMVSFDSEEDSFSFFFPTLFGSSWCLGGGEED